MESPDDDDPDFFAAIPSKWLLNKRLCQHTSKKFADLHWPLELEGKEELQTMIWHERDYDPAWPVFDVEIKRYHGNFYSIS